MDDESTCNDPCAAAPTELMTQGCLRSSRCNVPARALHDPARPHRLPSRALATFGCVLALLVVGACAKEGPYQGNGMHDGGMQGGGMQGGGMHGGGMQDGGMHGGGMQGGGMHGGGMQDGGGMQGGGMQDGGMHGAGMMGDAMMGSSAMMMRHLGAADANYDARFIAMMIPHHEGAVMMAKDALTNASRPELKALAQSIIDSQQQEVATMKQWQSSWAGGATPGMGGDGMAMDHDMKGKTGEMGAMGMKGKMGEMGEMRAMNARMTASLGPKDAGYEDRFITMMIPHHQGAIDMAKDALEKATHPELKQFARAIIVAQEKEIALMTDWRKQWYGR